MKLSEGVEWGLHLCMLLAFCDADKTLEAKRLAEYHELPLPYLRKTLQALARAGVIESVTGPGGGYRLARPPAQISFLDIFDAIDGTRSAFRCTEIRRKGPTGLDNACYPAACAIARTAWEAEQAWRDHLAAVTLFDITDGLTALASADQHQLAMDWLAIHARSSP